MSYAGANVEQHNLIGAHWRGGSGPRLKHRNPYSGETVAEMDSATNDDVLTAIGEAARAREGWAALTPGHRRSVLVAAADLLEARADAISSIMQAEVGGPVAWCEFNIAFAANILRHAGSQAYDALTGSMIPSDVPGKLSFAVRQPLGVVAAIAPWNAPLILGARSIAAPLAFGNVVVFKGSEQSPGTHAALVDAFLEAGTPAGVLNYIISLPEHAAGVTETLVSDDRVAHVNFTGSTRVGKIVARLAAESLTPTLLELGGKAPAVILRDADIEEAARAVSFGAFMNSGQICMSTERVIVDKTRFAEFAEVLVRRAKSLVVGDPRDSATEIGPMINNDAVAHVLELVEDARSKGATVLAGAQADGNCLSPTVISDVTPAMRVYSEETFGPVVVIIAAQDQAEAIELANDSRYSLAAAVFGTDVLNAYTVASKIDAGLTHVNSATVDDDPQAPFGGSKLSGWGQFGGRSSIDAFTRLRWITVQQGTVPYPI